ncbi:MAG: WG repeat-containing protein [Saprospiraceae bacterium]|nr:WG repeat-containing protein [Saprospiraceae bacterium]
MRLIGRNYDQIIAGYIDPSGALVLPAVYEAAAAFRAGLALVVLEGCWAYINRDGVVVWKE